MKIFKLVIVLVLAAGLFTAARSQTSTKHEVLFEKAKYTMESKGDLKEAISLFKDLIKKYPGARDFAAKAQLYIGLCYEKLGRTEAEKAFNMVLDNYPDQKETVLLARTRLDQIHQQESDLAQKAKGIQVHQVWADPPETYGGGISPNGRYLSFINWESVEMAMHDLETGKTWDVTNEGFWADDGQFPDASVWSPDSRQIAYYWIFGEGKTRKTELRIIGIHGGAYRILVQGGMYDSVMAPYPMCWSKDGKTIWGRRARPDDDIVGSRNDQMTWDREIVRITVESGEVESVYKLGKRGTYNGDISDDGRFLIYDVSQEAGSLIGDICIFATDGSSKEFLIKHKANDWGPRWSADGKAILFLSDRTGSQGLWSLAVEDGKAVGEPVLIQEGLPSSVSPLGITDEGGYYYSLNKELSDVFIAEIEMETGRILNEPEKLNTEGERCNYKPLWTRDGKMLVYLSYPLNFSWPRQKGADIVVHDLENGRERLIQTDALTPNSATLWFYPTLSSDGRFLIGLKENMMTQPEGFVKIDLESGESEILKAQFPESVENFGFWPRLSDDGGTLYYLSGDTRSIVSYDLQSKTERDIYRGEKAIWSVAFSPDLKDVVFRYWHDKPYELWKLSIDGGEPVLLASVADKKPIQIPVWTPDGKYILVTTYPGDKLYRLRSDGKKGFQIIDSKNELWLYPQIHPDGKRIVFIKPKGKYAEVWAMENYLPEKQDQE